MDKIITIKISDTVSMESDNTLTSNDLAETAILMAQLMAEHNQPLRPSDVLRNLVMVLEDRGL